MTPYQVPSNSAKNLFDFGKYLKRKAIFDICTLAGSIILGIIAFFYVFDILDILSGGYPPDIYQLMSGLMIPLIILTVIISGLGITSLVYTILMLISLSRAKDTYSQPQLDKAFLMLLLGVILAIFGIPLIGIILELIGWDAFKKFMVSAEETSTQRKEVEQSIRLYILSSAIIFGLTRIVTLVVLFPVMSMFMGIIMEAETMDPEQILNIILDNSSQLTNTVTIVSSISLVLEIIPLIFILKVSKLIMNAFSFAQNDSGASQQSYVAQSQPKTSDSTSKFCPKCGTKNPINAGFCMQCGNTFS
jgi:hypothetical protein